jgi:hypothetical protein
MKAAFAYGTNLGKIGVKTANEMHIKMLGKMLLETPSVLLDNLHFWFLSFRRVLNIE